MSSIDSAWRGKGALVTGASSGIGAAVARRLATGGARLTLGGRDQRRLDEVAASCRSLGAAAFAVAGDLTAEETRKRLVATATANENGVDLLVHSAGVTMNARFAELEPAVLRRIMEINFFAVAELTRLALPSLRARRGRVLVFSSVTGVVGPPTRSAYASSKHALHGLFGSLRVEMLRDGVGVTIVCPGYVDTPMRVRALLADGREQGHDQAEGREMLSAEKVAAAALRATARGRRLLLLGRATRLARVLSFVAPALLDRIMARVTR